MQSKVCVKPKRTLQQDRNSGLSSVNHRCYNLPPSSSKRFISTLYIVCCKYTCTLALHYCCCFCLVLLVCWSGFMCVSECDGAGLCLEKVPPSSSSKYKQVEWEEQMAKCFELAGDLTLLYLQEQDKMQQQIVSTGTINTASTGTVLLATFLCSSHGVFMVICK